MIWEFFAELFALINWKVLFFEIVMPVGIFATIAGVIAYAMLRMHEEKIHGIMQRIEPNDRYRRYDGNIYQVIGLGYYAGITVSERRVVCLKFIMGSNPDRVPQEGVIHVEPVDSFFDLVKWEGRKLSHFTLME